MTMRRSLGEVAGLAAVTALVATALTACGSSDTPKIPEFGVASIATLADRTEAGFREESAAIRSTGANWIRIVMNWNEIEPIAGHFRWPRLDLAVAAAREQGLSVLGLLEGPAPAWAGLSDGQGSVPRQASDFAAFAEAAASRYRAQVMAWEVWNEPNSPNYWTAPDAAAYSELLKASYPRIKAVAPAATVLSGGLSSDAGATDSTAFLRLVYETGGGESFDGVALHPYTHPYALGADPQGRDRTIGTVRELLTTEGDGGKKIWVTEWGQPTGGSEIAVTEDAQAEVILTSLERLSQVEGLGPTFLYTSRDWLDDPAQSEFNFGLYRYDYTPKPVVQRLREAANAQ